MFRSEYFFCFDSDFLCYTVTRYLLRLRLYADRSLVGLLVHDNIGLTHKAQRNLIFSKRTITNAVVQSSPQNQRILLIENLLL